MWLQGVVLVGALVTFSGCSHTFMHYEPTASDGIRVERTPAAASCTPAPGRARMRLGAVATLRLDYDPNPPFAFKLSLFILRGHNLQFDSTDVVFKSSEWAQPITRRFVSVRYVPRIRRKGYDIVQAPLPPSSVVTGELDTLDAADAEVIMPGEFMARIDLMGQQPSALTVQLPPMQLDGIPLPPLLVSFTAVRTRCRVTQLM